MAAPAPLGVLATFISINIATIGIVNAFVLSRYNERASRRRARLDAQLSYLQRRTLELPSGLSEQSITLLKNERDQTKTLTIRRPSRFLTGWLALLPLTFFLFSFFLFYFIEFGGAVIQLDLQIDPATPGLLAHIFFVVGVISLVAYAYSVMKLLRAYLKFYTPKICRGELKWADPKHDKKTITKSFSEENVLKVKVHFKGFVANGFIDTLFVCTDGAKDYQMWVPDRATYLSPTSYNMYRTLIVKSGLNTGILQGNIDHVFPLEFRVGESSHISKPSSFIYQDEHAPAFEDYYLPENVQIKELRIRMYVDPLHIPRAERDSHGELVVINSDMLQSEN